MSSEQTDNEEMEPCQSGAYSEHERENRSELQKGSSETSWMRQHPVILVI